MSTKNMRNKNRFYYMCAKPTEGEPVAKYWAFGYSKISMKNWYQMKLLKYFVKSELQLIDILYNVQQLIIIFLMTQNFN